MKNKRFPTSQVCACCGAVRNPATDQHFIVLNPHYTKEEQKYLPSAFNFQYITYFESAPELSFCNTVCLVEYLNSPNAQLAWAKFEAGKCYDAKERKSFEFRPSCRHCKAELKANENSTQSGVIIYKAIVVLPVYGSPLFHEKRVDDKPQLYCSPECLIAACGDHGSFSSVNFWNRSEHRQCPQCSAVHRPYEHNDWLVLNYEPPEENAEGWSTGKYLYSSDSEHREIYLCSAQCMAQYLKGQPILKWFKVQKIYPEWDFCGHCHGLEAMYTFLSFCGPYGSRIDENFVFFCSLRCAIRVFQRDNFDAKLGF